VAANRLVQSHSPFHETFSRAMRFPGCAVRQDRRTFAKGAKGAKAMNGSALNPCLVIAPTGAGLAATVAAGNPHGSWGLPPMICIRAERRPPKPASPDADNHRHDGKGREARIRTVGMRDVNDAGSRLA
jgi:hypothetical protein